MKPLLTLPCAQGPEDKLYVLSPGINELCIVVNAARSFMEDKDTRTIWLSSDSEERLFQFLSQRRGIAHFQQRAADDDLERAALAATNTDAIAETLAALRRTLQEFAPAAEAIVKLASYAIEDGLAESARIP